MTGYASSFPTPEDVRSTRIPVFNGAPARLPHPNVTSRIVPVYYIDWQSPPGRFISGFYPPQAAIFVAWLLIG